MSEEKIELVIRIPKELYEAYKGRPPRLGDAGMDMIAQAIANGTPLSKEHGRLIDADALVKKMEEREERLNDDRSMWETAGVEVALDMFAQTIIESSR